MTEISVVIAASNRAERLRACLDALASQTAPRDAYEVVVVDDGVTEATAEVVAAFGATSPVRVVRQAGGGRAAALNHGIASASGDYCLFLDDGIVADAELVEEHLRAQRDCGGGLGLGGVRVAPARGGLSRYFSEWWAEHQEHLGATQGDFWPLSTGALSAPTAAIRSLGGFDEGLGQGEEIELAYRIERSGLPVAHLRCAGGERGNVDGFRGIVSELDRAGAAAFVLYSRHPELLQRAPLGDFSRGWVGSVALRRLLLAARVPVWPIGLIDPVLGRQPPARLYRFLLLYCFWRGVRGALDDRDTWRRLTRGTVILMYHAVGEPGERASRFVVPAARFRRQLAWLRLRRRPVLTLDEYVRARENNRLPPAGSVVITFDDGYADTGEVGAPILCRNDMPATVFIVTGATGAVNAWEEAGPLAGRRLLSWDGVRKLRDDGMTVGAHSVSHPRLTELDASSLELEVTESRTRLERELGTPVRHFAYPFGRTSAEVANSVRRAGFASACGVKPGVNGPAVPIHDLRRMEVRGTRSLPRFAIDLWAGRPLRFPRLGRRS